jgi:formate-dependent nitrite reductase membrane component NrfD
VSDPGSYYGRPYLKTPVWKPEVAGYFWVGGLAGASATLALAARLAGNRRLHRSALGAALAGSVISPALLIEDLGRPERFLNMLRVFKPTSPMSVGSWVLAGFGTATGGAAVSEFTGLLRPLGRLAEVVAAALGPALATYTGVLVANTAIPTWHESRRYLPFVFAGGAMASAGGLAAMTTPTRRAGPARRLALLGAGLELAASTSMEVHLGELAAPYRDGAAARASRAALALTSTGAAVMALAGRRRPGAILAGSLLLSGALAERIAVFKAGIQSARETKPGT